METVNNYEADRRKKLEALRALGIDPFRPHSEAVLPNPISEVRQFFNAETPLEQQPVVKVAGRIILKRDFGKKLSFLTIRDETGDIQIALSKQRLTDAFWAVRDNLDLFDIIFVSGQLGPTQTGELTVWASSLYLGGKALLPPPTKDQLDDKGNIIKSGFTDIEQRYRQRYVDLAANADVMKTMLMRSKIISYIRGYLEGADYVEVETPILQSLYGGAAAEPFLTHHNALKRDFYLRIAPELYLKRLLVGGVRCVYEIGKNFRNEGISPKHSPEFTVLEAYEAWGSYQSMMETLTMMIASIVDAFDINHPLIDFTPPFRVVRLGELVAEYKQTHAEVEGDAVHIYETFIEPTLIHPTFVINFPAKSVPLARVSTDAPDFGWGPSADNFEFVMNGQEIAPGYSEQNDPDIQLAIFNSQKTGDDHAIDLDFIEALKVGMPPAGGMGIGLDRLIAILLNQPNVKDVILFPTLKS